MIISHRRDSAIHTHVSILPQTPFPSRLAHNTEFHVLYCWSLLVIHLKYSSVPPMRTRDGQGALSSSCLEPGRGRNWLAKAPAPADPGGGRPLTFPPWHSWPGQVPHVAEGDENSHLHALSPGVFCQTGLRRARWRHFLTAFSQG